MIGDMGSSTHPGGVEDFPPPHDAEIAIACRKSELALVQARGIAAKLGESLDMDHPPRFSVVTRSVAGDADKQSPFALLSKQTGGSDVGKSLWTNGLETDLVADKVQVLVHCLKDMPTTLPANCLLGAIPAREDPSDAVIMRPDSPFKTIDQLPPGSVR
ncbi:porphobilinogen deaminase [Purpureocillium lavendulum]|uniref:hydroxymethylbilane synthase n=1 Tax=Purpureocillium lavendulum TaxID=1247861 RepID=A0AB34FQQ2_9HYPO|nr:porphobilinogen deaminase [Purpureocillium lavendulum]